MVKKKDHEELINLRAFDCLCQKCGHRFIGLNFPDFEYGRRMLRTKGGKHLALWVAHEDEVVDEFQSLLRRIVGYAKSPRDEACLFDIVFGITCDPVNGEPIDASQEQVCPACGSDSLNTFDLIPKRIVPTTVQRIQHTLWSKKQIEEKESALRLALVEARTRQKS